MRRVAAPGTRDVETAGTGPGRGARTGAPTIERLGWDDRFAAGLPDGADGGLRPARVAVAHNAFYQLLAAGGEVMAELAGRLRRSAGADERPVVGDWVAVRLGADGRTGTIEAVLPRRCCFSRKAAGEPTRRQLVAANVDAVLVVCGLDGDFNPRRIERYLAAVRHSGADPVLVLSKADLCADPEARRAAVAALAPDAPLHVVNALRPGGAEPLRPHLRGRTGALIGSSGVGKSTIINRLLGCERQRTAAVRRRDGRGRHTTTRRELILLPGGGLVIDTPGMRELRLWDDADALDDAFDDVRALAAACRFRDCGHDREPRCAVRRAVETGRLSAARLDSFRRLRREREAVRRRREELARRDERRAGTANRAVRAFRSNRLTGEG